MTPKLISSLVVLAVGIAVAPATAAAATPAAQSSAGSNGIIAILIGQIHAQPFTPPIGTEIAASSGRSSIASTRPCSPAMNTDVSSKPLITRRWCQSAPR